MRRQVKPMQMRQLRKEKFDRITTLCQADYFVSKGFPCYSRVIPIGDCELVDFENNIYGCGFAIVEITYEKPGTEEGTIKISYAVPGEGTCIGHSIPMSKKEAEVMIKKLGQIYDDLERLPVTSLMNYLLKDYTIVLECSV